MPHLQESVSRQYAKVISKISVKSDNGKDLENIVEEALEICTTKNALKYLEEAKERMEITAEALTE